MPNEQKSPLADRSLSVMTSDGVVLTTRIPDPSIRVAHAAVQFGGDLLKPRWQRRDVPDPQSLAVENFLRQNGFNRLPSMLQAAQLEDAETRCDNQRTTIRNLTTYVYALERRMRDRKVRTTKSLQSLREEAGL